MFSHAAPFGGYLVEYSLVLSLFFFFFSLTPSLDLMQDPHSPIFLGHWI